MKKILISLLLISSAAFGQLNLGLGGGFSNIKAPAYYTKSIPEGGFGFTNEYHLGVKAKVSLPVIPLKPFGFFNYYSLKGSGNMLGAEVNTSQTILSYGLGIEYAIVPGPISPYFSIEAGYNNLGKIKFESPLTSTDIRSNSSALNRVGVGVGFGAEINLLVFTLDSSIKYQFLNVSGKEPGEETISCLNVNFSILF
jgi:hypothetical protein